MQKRTESYLLQRFLQNFTTAFIGFLEPLRIEYIVIYLY